MEKKFCQNVHFIPDFSNDKIELELLTRQFDDIKAFIKETDLLKKSSIAKQISEKVLSLVSELIKEKTFFKKNQKTDSKIKLCVFQ